MRSFLMALVAVAVAVSLPATVALGADSPAYRLAPKLTAGDAARITVSLEVGGELILVDADRKESRVPMSVVANLAYDEQLVAWWADPTMASRSLRRYSQATATLKSDEKGDTRQLTDPPQLIVAAAAAEATTVGGLEGPLTRRERDLLDVVGNSLVLDRLLPGRELKEAEGWDHDAATMGALLGMDHVAICEVRSVVTGEENRQVQIRLAGTVHGTVEGAASEMDLRGAYLYHLDEGRITKFNMAIKEARKPGEVSPGLDVVAKLSLVARPLLNQSPFGDEQLEQARQLTSEQLNAIVVESPERGYRFHHAADWYVTAEQRELMSLRLVAGGEFLAHCNVTTLTPRPADKPLSLHQFEEEVVKSLGDKLEKVEAATEWANEAGHQCLGVIAVGKVEETPVQWRHYHVAAEGQRPVAVAVTLEAPLAERFGDADRAIIESMVLLPPPAATAAAVKLAPAPK